jgi:hypothetical protein
MNTTINIDRGYVSLLTCPTPTGRDRQPRVSTDPVRITISVGRHLPSASSLSGRLLPDLGYGRVGYVGGRATGREITRSTCGASAFTTRGWAVDRALASCLFVLCTATTASGHIDVRGPDLLKKINCTESADISVRTTEISGPAGRTGRGRVLTARVTRETWFVVPLVFKAV